MKKVFLMTILSLTLIACDRQDNLNNSPPTRQYHSTEKNIPDRDAISTPLDESESDADQTITQIIRQVIMSDSALSANAKNIKIISTKGVVTLRGPVASLEEKDTIARKVNDVQGIVELDNQLEVTYTNY